VAGVPQPARSVALQVAASITDTLPGLPLPAFATYTVWVWPSTATADGLSPTMAVAGVVAQPDGWLALQPLVSIIDTVLVPEVT
jgi:hypothetical protein